MEVDEPPVKFEETPHETPIEPPKEGETPKVEETPKPEEPEPLFQILTTPARVTRKQIKYISFDLDPRYNPISEGVHGIVVLKDTKPEDKEELIEYKLPSLEFKEDDIAPPPDSFEYLG